LDCTVFYISLICCWWSTGEVWDRVRWGSSGSSSNYLPYIFRQRGEFLHF